MSHIDNYMRWITPTVGDPTYSLLKAHLLFEELLRAHLQRVLPHADALQGARLTFVQLLAVARASSTAPPPDHWVWKAVGDLNKLRNMLSHEVRPKDFLVRMKAYTSFVSEQAQAPLPEPAFHVTAGEVPPTQPLYSAADLATIVLYYRLAGLLGFNLDKLVEKEESRARSLGGDAEPERPGNAG